MKAWQWWLVTFGGSGALKPAPGTWGSLAAVLVLLAIHSLISPVAWPVLLVCFIVAASASNVMLGSWIVRTLGEDPGACVIDEAAGIGLTLLGVPMSRPLIAFAAAFVAFRIFDVTKIPPARQLEQLPLGWGILMDDLAAAVYANILVQVFLRLMI